MTKWFQTHAKRMADMVTGIRVMIAFSLPWLGLVYGAASLPTAVWLMLTDWTGDSLDGAISRRNRPLYHTWLGDHDLEVDILVSIGLLAYLSSIGVVTLLWAGLYLAVWFLILWRWQMPRSLGMFGQAPIYGWFIFTALQTIPTVGGWLLGWIIVAMIVTWPRFPQEIVPNFLAGIRNLFK